MLLPLAYAPLSIKPKTDDSLSRQIGPVAISIMTRSSNNGYISKQKWFIKKSITMLFSIFFSIWVEASILSIYVVVSRVKFCNIARCNKSRNFNKNSDVTTQFISTEITMTVVDIKDTTTFLCLW